MVPTRATPCALLRPHVENPIGPGSELGNKLGNSARVVFKSDSFRQKSKWGLEKSTWKLINSLHTLGMWWGNFTILLTQSLMSITWIMIKTIYRFPWIFEIWLNLFSRARNIFGVVNQHLLWCNIVLNNFFLYYTQYDAIWKVKVREHVAFDLNNFWFQQN